VEIKMTYAVDIYVDRTGRVYGAAQTDHLYTRAGERTVNGQPVAYAGCWYGSQMPYQPYKRAVAEAQAAAAKKS
jgi:hypothetical protein